MARLEQADIIAIFGGSGSGKSFRFRNLTKHDKRLVVWDSMSEYDELAAINGDIRLLLGVLSRKKKFRIAFRPDFENFDEQFRQFCKLVYAVGNMTVGIEELNEVTKPSYAPPHWRSLTSRGRHRGLHIRGMSQRPASVDKDFIGNATEIYAGRLPYAPDWKSLHGKFGSDASELEKFPLQKQKHWKG